jgi:hypothetical protein
MTDIVPHTEPPRKKGNGVETQTPPQTPASADFFDRFADLAAAYDTLRGAYRQLRNAVSWNSHDMPLAKAKYLVAMFGDGDDAELKALWPNEKDIYRVSRKHIALRLCVMVGAYPNASPHNADMYAERMLTHVAGAHPSAMALESACLKVEASHKFLPTPAEMLTALHEAEREWDDRLSIDVEEAHQLGDALIARLTRFEVDTLARLDRDGYVEMAAKVRSRELTAKAAADQVLAIERERARKLYHEKYQREAKEREAQLEAMLIREQLIEDPAQMQALAKLRK